MVSFGSSGSSNSSESHGVPMLDAEEVGRKLQLDERTIDYLKNAPVNDDDPVLVLNYQEAFSRCENFANNKQIISTSLTNMGATLVSENVFKFNDWLTMYEARRQMRVSVPWAFFNSDADLARRNGISQQPTITTTAITWFSEATGKLIIQPYEFFEF